MNEQLGFIGGGVMAEAIIHGVLHRHVVPSNQISVSDVLEERRNLIADRFAVTTFADSRDVARRATLIILAVKPQQIASVFRDLQGHLDPEQVIVSIVAGARVTALARGLAHPRIVRVMPNTPARVGFGMSVWTASAAVETGDKNAVQTILRTLGREAYVEDEEYLDMATAINGSGPGYVFLFLEALIDAAVHLGLSRAFADELVVQTVLGSAHLAQATGEHPARLKNLVTSPGGTTAAGLAALEASGFRAAVDRAVLAAFERSRELGREAESGVGVG